MNNNDHTDNTGAHIDANTDERTAPNALPVSFLLKTAPSRTAHDTSNSTSHVQERRQPTLFDAVEAERVTGKLGYPVPVFSVRLVRERELTGPSAATPAEVAGLLWEYLKEADREHLVVAMFTANLRLIGLSTAHVGSLTASVVSAREVFKPAVLANACSVVVAHNHPSGNLEPSEADVLTSRRLAKAGEALDIPLIDSLIIGFGGAFTSLKARGLI